MLALYPGVGELQRCSTTILLIARVWQIISDFKDSLPESPTNWVQFRYGGTYWCSVILIAIYLLILFMTDPNPEEIPAILRRTQYRWYYCCIPLSILSILTAPPTYTKVISWMLCGATDTEHFVRFCFGLLGSIIFTFCYLYGMICAINKCIKDFKLVHKKYVEFREVESFAPLTNIRFSRLHNFPARIFDESQPQLLSSISTSQSSTMAFKYANFPASAPLPTPDSEGKITLRTTAKTDAWRKPPAHDVFNAPFMYKSLPVSRFKSARVSAIGEWNTLFDQGGLMIVLPSTKSRPTEQKRWIKTGIEFYHGKPMMSVVATDLWSDWSLLPLSAEDEKEGRMSVVVEREEEEGGWGSVLKILLVGKDRQTPIREVTWAFHDLDEDEEIWVGIAVAKPTIDEKNELTVRFEGFEIETRD